MNAAELDAQNVVWDSPSADSNGSMPIGNGDLAANVWVEANGDLLFYLSKSDAWSSEQELLKLGRVRVRLDQPFVRAGSVFKQTLDLKTGTIRIQSTTNSQLAEIRFWIDANHPVVNVEINGASAFTAQVMLEPWRISGATLYGGAVPDTILPAQDNTIRWYQRNSGSIYDSILSGQNLGHLVGNYPDPLKNLTFGGLISGTGLISSNATTLVTQGPVSDLHLRIHALTAKTTTPEEWVQQLQAQSAAAEGLPVLQTRAGHESYWADFWNKSWIFVSPRPGSTVPSLIPSNPLNFRAGADTNNGNQFTGSLGRMTLMKRALESAEIGNLATAGPNGPGMNDADALYTGTPAIGTVIQQSATWTNEPQMTFEAWINPSAGNPGTRILDKSTPGSDDGFLLDTYPGNSLRLIIGTNYYAVPNCLAADTWNHVAVAVDAETNRIEMYLNGQRIAGRAPVERPTDEFAVTRAYVLQRWIQACAGRGADPIKFNGSLFTVDHPQYGPDWRQWGGAYWFQNTREPYWGMLYSGDYEQMEPLWRMYREAVPLLKARTLSYFNHGGMHCSETMFKWGLPPQYDYGYGNPGPYGTNPYTRYYFDSGNELCMMMLDYHAHTQDQDFVTTTLLPIADEVIKFYDLHYPRTAQGKLLVSPSSSLETWHAAENPLPTVVGLRTILPRLLQLPQSLTTAEQRQRWNRFLSELPEVPTGEDAGKKWIKPAEVYSDQRNSENPELYAVFPYRANTVGKPELEVALETWRRRLVKRTGGWTQDPIQAAMLGLTQEAKDDVVANATDRSPLGRPAVEPRFPAFWGPNFDWLPDQCHGSVTVIALQRMLMLCDGDAIQLLPAWPQDWDVSFKLHAPRQTTIECVYQNGRLEKLNVTPESRRNDVVLPSWMPPTSSNLLANGSFENDSVATFGTANSELPGIAAYAGADDGYFSASGWTKTNRVWLVGKGTETFPDGNLAYRIDGDFYGEKDVLAQGGLSLVAGKTYQLTFALWGEAWGQPTENLDVRLTRNPGNLTDSTSGTGVLILDDKTTATSDQTAETVTVLFTPSVTGSNYALQFIADSEDAEFNGDHVWIDDITLQEVPNLIVNGSFEADGAATFNDADTELPGTAKYAGAFGGYYTAPAWSATSRIWLLEKGTETFPGGNYAYKIDGNGAAGGMDVLAQGGLSLESGQTYRLTFDIWGVPPYSITTEKLDVRLTRDYSSLTDPTSGTGVLVLNDKTSVANDGLFESVTVDFTPSVTSTSYALQFFADNTAYRDDHICIDNIVLSEVIAPPPVTGTYADWAAANGVAGAVDEDSDNDGVENGVEYFMGITSGAPVFTANPALGSTNTISWPKSATYDGTYEVETSTDLGIWTPVIPRPTPVGGYLTYTLPPGVPEGRNFVRLLVIPN